MPTTAKNLLLRNDTILGVCEAIGQDFGFHPNYLRVLLASLVYFNPVAVIGGYLALGLVVAASRYFAPDQSVPQVGVEQAEPEELALAA